MSWYDYIPGPGGINPGALGGGGGIDGLAGVFGVGSGDPSNPYRNALNANAQQQAQFAAQQQAGLVGTQGMLQAQANGQNSVSMAQGQQMLQQAQAQQTSMAAGAAPSNQAMAARNALLNTGMLGAGAMGTQAMAGLQERNQAAQLLAGSQMQGALGAYGLANNAYGTNLQNPQQTWAKLAGGAIGGAAGGAAKFG